ncbi:MAG: holo-ACP synthase [Endomicrobium sp.]|jgi:holo-[acyl-carrier protein] synthase|nr:holo-ACP synthase [Endomicrobium sp.]
MKINIGVDIEEIERFAKYVKNKKCLERVFSSEEIAYSIARRNSLQHLAARFAAKEAAWKALSSKYKNGKFMITDISIKNNKVGKPYVYIKNRRCKKIDISLSHTSKYVIAFAIVF